MADFHSEQWQLEERREYYLSAHGVCQNQQIYLKLAAAINSYNVFVLLLYHNSAMVSKGMELLLYQDVKYIHISHTSFYGVNNYYQY